MSWITRLTNAFRPAKANADLESELQFHLEKRIADLAQSGLTQPEAERKARLQLGNRLALREESYEIKSAVWLESLLRDFRFGLRMLAKYRSASLAAVVSLALAIGACTAAFSLIDALMLRPLPVRDPQQLFDLVRVFPPFMSPNNQRREFDQFSYPQFKLLRDTARGSTDLFLIQYNAALRPAIFDDAGGASENIRPQAIDGCGFGILGLKPIIGRLIEPDDDSLDNGRMVAVLSYPFWKRRFGGSPSVIGHKVTIGKTFEIVGVVAPPFSGVFPGYLTDVWFPFSTPADPRLFAEDVELGAIWGRLQPGTNRSQLHDRLQAVFTNALRERVRVNPPRNHGSAAHGRRFGERIRAVCR